jgi:hypothetical protein
LPRSERRNLTPKLLLGTANLVECGIDAASRGGARLNPCLARAERYITSLKWCA